MEAATLGPTPPRSRPVQVALVASLLAVAAGAWAVTGDRMGGMDAGPGTELGGLGWFAGVWVTMMAAMMLPSIAPMVLAHARVQIAATPAFLAGYLLTWGAVGLLGWALVEGVRSLELGVLAWDEAGPYLAGGAILAAAIYQLSRPKKRSLRRCRKPRAFVSEHWRPGCVGALRMGIEHGRVCVGSSWALMATLFALGVMSVGWMVLVAGLIAAEKLLPSRELASRGILVLLAVLAVGVGFAPEDVPGLTIPGSPAAMEAVERMGIEFDGADETDANGRRDRAHALAPITPQTSDRKAGATPIQPSGHSRSHSLPFRERSSLDHIGEHQLWTRSRRAGRDCGCLTKAAVCGDPLENELAAPLDEQRARFPAPASLSQCATDESQALLSAVASFARVRVGASDDELKRRVWD
jgi:predicted metal-binding membrane protein